MGIDHKDNSLRGTNANADTNADTNADANTNPDNNPDADADTDADGDANPDTDTDAGQLYHDDGLAWRIEHLPWCYRNNDAKAGPGRHYFVL